MIGLKGVRRPVCVDTFAVFVRLMTLSSTETRSVGCRADPRARTRVHKLTASHVRTVEYAGVFPDPRTWMHLSLSLSVAPFVVILCVCVCVCADAGRDVDNKILTHFAAQWAEKKKLNLYESPKAVLRLTAAIDKVKQQLSGYNTSVKLPVNVECLQDDHDFASTLSTEELQAQILNNSLWSLYIANILGQ